VQNSLKILLLEDSADDAELIDHELRLTGLKFSARQVFLESTFRTALEEFEPDVVLVDAKLPGFDGYSAIRLVRTRDAALPVIAVTGQLDDDDAVDLLRAGANDYVLKDRLARLGPAVRRAVDERTERERRAAAEARYQRLFAAAKDGIVVTDAETGIVVDINPAMAKMIREKPGSVVGAHLWDIAALVGICNSLEAYRDMVDGTAPVARDGVLGPRGGRTIEVEMTGGAFDSGGTRVYQCNVRDVSERNRLRRGMLAAADREKHRLAREIHDGLGQELVGLDMLIHGVVRELSRDRLPSAGEINRLPTITRHALEACHAIAHGLSPLSSTAGGLPEALRGLKARLGGPPGPILECEIFGDAGISLDTDACSHLYRIAQEAVANAIKHAGANRIEITMRVDREFLELRISDDGRGLTKRGTSRHGLGLQTMRDRAASIGASLQFATPAGGGTTVACQVPQAGGSAVL
jgi:PAS domain S-box-containing protein